MSIVEKAISKLQQAQLRSPAAPKIRPVQESAAPQALPDNVQVLWPAGSPSRRIHLDFEALRVQGMLPPTELARQLTDQYRRIKWPLLDAAFGKSAEPVNAGALIMVTSSLPEEGKTFTSLNLALSVAQERDCTVLLVDADIAKGHLTRLFGLTGQPGLVDVLADERMDLSDAVVATDIEGLEFLPAGSRNQQAPELFSSQRMQKLVREHGERFPGRIMLFDSSPVLATNEAQVLARLVGQILLVVHADHTPQPAVMEALALLDRSKAISCLLNQSHGDLASDYYGAYGHYGHDQPAK